jgi:hypothetical protein
MRSIGPWRKGDDPETVLVNALRQVAEGDVRHAIVILVRSEPGITGCESVEVSQSTMEKLLLRGVIDFAKEIVTGGFEETVVPRSS